MPPTLDLSITITGGVELERALQQLAANANVALGAALYEWAAAKMERIKVDDVPIDTGALRDSGFVERPQVTSDGVSVTMGFGGAAKDYAVYVHEILENKHPHGRAKYLEAPLNEEAAHIPAALAQSLQAAIARGGH